MIRYLQLCVYAVLLVPGFASGSAAAGIEHEAVSTVQLHRGCKPTYDQLASDSLLAAKGASSRILGNSAEQLQRKFKHAGDFGVIGNYSRANAAEFSRALNQHINSDTVKAISGTYRGNPVTHYLDPGTGLNVIADPAGNFVSGWRLHSAQLQNVFSRGSL